MSDSAKRLTDSMYAFISRSSFSPPFSFQQINWRSTKVSEKSSYVGPLKKKSSGRKSGSKGVGRLGSGSEETDEDESSRGSGSEAGRSSKDKKGKSRSNVENADGGTESESEFAPNPEAR